MADVSIVHQLSGKGTPPLVGGAELPHPPILKKSSNISQVPQRNLYNYTVYMDMIRTVKLRLQTSPEVFMPTIEAYTKAFNYVAQTSWDDNDRNGVSLHHKTYRKCREYLTADLTCSARTKAIEAVKSVRALQKNENALAKYHKREPKLFSCPQSQHASIRHNDKTFTIWFDRNEVSVQTLTGRVKCKFVVPDYFKQYLSWKRCSADLFVRRGHVFLNVVFEKTVESVPHNGKCIGIDRGITQLAVTSDNRFFGGGRVKQVSRRYQRLRSALQKKGHSGKRHLRKISFKENRFRSDVNHCISKQIVSSLKRGATIVLEDLTGLRARTINKRRSKTPEQREDKRQHSSWSYYQLEFFLKYKAEANGVTVDYVDARYTSQKCSRCGHVAKGNRAKQSIFHCESCGFHLNADLNASRVIVLNYLDAISQQRGRCHPDRACQEASCSQPLVA
jgi:putative transposase